MSARADLYAALMAGGSHSPDRSEKASALIDAFCAELDNEVTGANLSRWDEEQDHARTRLALKSARRGRRDLRARVSELGTAAVEGRAALASFCHDHEDPGTAALGALYLLQQATSGTAMQPGETMPEVFRAEHPESGITLGHYGTAAAARAHCEALVRREIPGASLDWIEDDEDRVAELVAAFGEDERSTGYIVTGLELASEYDEEADE